MLTLCEACNQQEIQHASIEEENDDDDEQQQEEEERTDRGNERISEDGNSEKRVKTGQEDLFFTSFTSTILMRCKY